jgi:hypothetical protein
MSKELITQIDEILSILEAKLPASPTNPDNLKFEAALKNSLSQYFQGLEKAFPYYLLTKFYDLHVQKESIVREVAPPKIPIPLPDDPDGWDWLDNTLKAFSTDLAYRLNTYLVQLYLQGSMQVMTYGINKMGIPIQFEGPPMRAAVEWADKYCAQLVTNLDDESKSQIAKIISDGIDNKSGIDGISRDIRAQFEDMSKYRADMIARTETSHALRTATVDRIKTFGSQYGKEWILGSGGKEGNCEECIKNADAGVIPVDQDFPIPEDEIHPNCTCTISPAVLPEAD